ncbi:MAG: dihydrolipoyl dehydrogenase [Deltaproteobacteria bacterium]|nr:dihydrolipoyl dehydrogenase [Deltaproteobacteria bacterium]
MDYDLCVIGAGPAGYTAAISASKMGLKTAVLEGSSLGGVCTNKGCIPTKSYLETTRFLKQLSNARRFAIDVEDWSCDLSSLKKRKDRIVNRLARGVEYLLKENNVSLYASMAEIIDKNTVRSGNEVITTESILVATGSRPKNLPYLDSEHVWTSDNIFDVEDLPSSLLIVGGGAIGIEMAEIFSTLGTKVTVVESMDRILPMEDPIVSEELTSILRNINIFTSSKVGSIRMDSPDGHFEVLVQTQKGDVSMKPEKVLISTGRQPNVPRELLEMGIELNATGGIKTGPTMETSIKGIYAAGDVTGEYMLAYVAMKQGQVAAENISGHFKTMDYDYIPSVIFTSPEIASVGRPMEKLKNSKKGIFPVSALGRARTMERNSGFAQIHASPDGRMERVTIVAPHATELIGWAVMALRQGMKVDEFLRATFPHPTVSEILKEAAEDVMGLSIHKP